MENSQRTKPIRVRSSISTRSKLRGVQCLSPLVKAWEFETRFGCDAEIFLVVLNMFHIIPDDEYIPSYLDFSQIHFFTTRKKKEQIECVFKRFLNGREVIYAIY